MTQHFLQDRTEREVLWMQRRAFLSAAGTWVACGGFAAAWAQQRTNVVDLVGDVLVNGQRLRPQDPVQSGDTVQTGPGSIVTFVIGNSAFHVRQNSRVAVERGASLNAVSVLRLLTGAVGSVWGRGASRQIITPTLTAGIRGTGVYTEVQPANDNRTYFCTCWGAVDLSAGVQQIASRSDYHQSFWIDPQPASDGRQVRPARALNHTDDEIEMLAAIVNQPTSWQRLGRKGVRDGRGFLQERPESDHPAAPVTR